MKIKSLGKALSFRGNFLALALIAFSFSTSAQVYQVDAAYGRQIRRYAVDTTLIIPTVCGVPTLRSTVTNKAAIAVDSCNKVFYFYDPKTATWNTITGGGGGSTGISTLGTGYGLITVNDSTYRVDSTVMVNIARLNNHLALKLSLSDTASMLSPYLRSATAAATYQPILTAGTNITIVGSTISASGGSSGTTVYETQTASGSTAFTFTTVPAVMEDYMIFRNGVKLVKTVDYTTIGNIVTIPAIVTGDEVTYQRIK